MIERLTGTVLVLEEKQITLMVHGIGFGIQVPDPTAFSLQKEVTVYTYVHYTQDKGISFFGFPDELSRIVFNLIIGCPKIGPSIAQTILRQCKPADFIQIITSQDEAALSSFSGIGAKKAEQMVVSLKGPVGKLVSSGALASMTGDAATMAQWQHLADALTSLNYSKQEISDAIAHIRELQEQDGSAGDLNTMLRRALAFLA